MGTSGRKDSVSCEKPEIADHELQSLRRKLRRHGIGLQPQFNARNSGALTQHPDNWFSLVWTHRRMIYEIEPRRAAAGLPTYARSAAWYEDKYCRSKGNRVACECRGHLRRESINGDKYAIENPDAVASSLRTHNESDQGPAHALIPKSATTGSIEQQLPTRRVDEVFRKGIDNDNAGRCLRDRTVYRATHKPHHTAEFEEMKLSAEKEKAPTTSQGLSYLRFCLRHFLVVEVSGIEPLTSCMPCKRSPS